MAGTQIHLVVKGCYGATIAYMCAASAVMASVSGVSCQVSRNCAAFLLVPIETLSGY